MTLPYSLNRHPVPEAIVATPGVQNAIVASTRSPRDRAHGGRLLATWLVLITIFVSLCLALGPSGILAQMQVASPTINSVTPGDGKLSIEWTAPTGVTGITAYDLRYIETSADETVDGNWTKVEDVWTGSGDLDTGSATSTTGLATSTTASDTTCRCARLPQPTARGQGPLPARLRSRAPRSPQSLQVTRR